MDVLTVDHPLVARLLTRLRDETTDRATFRLAMDELAGMLVYEACRTLPTEPVDIRTPMAAATGVRIASPPLVVPVLRAGLGLHGAVIRLLPETETAFVGVSRNEDDAPARALHELGARRPCRPRPSWCSTPCSRPADRWSTPAGSCAIAAPGR